MELRLVKAYKGKAKAYKSAPMRRNYGDQRLQRVVLNGPSVEVRSVKVRQSVAIYYQSVMSIGVLANWQRFKTERSQK